MNSNDILNQIGHRTGMTVPEGYFDNFTEQMCAKLPEQPWEKATTPNVMPRSFWQKVRPYVYMAAMFAGIWCMMKGFDMVRSDSTIALDKNPQLISAVNNDAFFNDYCTSDVSESELYDELYNDGFDPSSLDSL